MYKRQHFHLSKSRVNDAVSTLEKTILETAKKRERELSEKKTLIDRLYERLELTREMVAEGEKQLTESEMKLQKAKEENARGEGKSARVLGEYG